MLYEELKIVCQQTLGAEGKSDGVLELCRQHLGAEAVNLQVVSDLGSAAYEDELWALAGAAFGLLSSVNESVRLESTLIAAHCAVETGQVERAEELVERVDALMAAGGERDDPALRGILRVLYKKANAAFGEGNYAKARCIYNVFVPHDSRLKHVVSGRLGAKGSEPDWDKLDLGERLARASADWEAGRIPVPAWVERLERRAAGKSLTGTRVLLAMATPFSAEDNARRHEIPRYFQATAAALGIEVTLFEMEPLIFISRSLPDQRVKHVQALFDVVASFNPDYVVFDNPFAVVEDPVLKPEDYKRWLLALKEGVGFKLIGWYPDAWNEKCHKAIALGGDILDAIWSSHAGVDAYLKECGIPESKLVSTPLPIPDGIFCERLDCKEVQTGFVGSSLHYNYLRSLWFLSMWDHEVPFELRLTGHNEAKGHHSLAEEDYASALGRLKTSLQFSARNEYVSMLCGRVWESILSGCCLVEEANYDTKQFLVPYVHYVPFNNIGELKATTEFLAANEHWRHQVAEAGLRWWKERLPNQTIWSAVLATADGSHGANGKS